MPILHKKKAKLVKGVITQWLGEGVVSADEADKLSNSIEIMEFDWKRLAKYSFWVSIICLATSVCAALSDKLIIELIKNLFHSPDSFKTVSLSFISGGLYYWGYRRKFTKPNLFYSTEAIFFFGVITTALAIMYFGKIIDNGSGHFSILILISCILYGCIALLVESKMIWVFSIVSLGSWFGTETGYISGRGAYFLGMNYPMRFVLFGIALTVLSHILRENKQTNQFFHPTFVMGLLYSFVSLWILSIFGNYGDMHVWRAVKQIELFHYALLFAMAACGAIYYGLKHDNATARGFGITFLFINLYTRFCEYFWDNTHKAIFFAVIGLSFWYLGSRAEKIWAFGKSNDSTEKFLP